MGSCTTVRLERSGAVATMVMVPPAGKPPTMEHGFFDSLDRAIDTVAAATETRVAVLRSEHAKVFCAGGNIEMLRRLDRESMGGWIDRGHDTLDRLESLSVPVIAVVEGFALGGGLELALACDLIYAADGARLGQTEAKLGFIAGWGGSFRLLRRVGLAKAKELFFTADVVDGPAAAEIGLADFSGTSEALHERLDAVISSICECSAKSVADMKAILTALSAVACEPRVLERERSIELVESSDTRARVEAFLSRRRDRR